MRRAFFLSCLSLVLFACPPEEEPPVDTSPPGPITGLKAVWNDATGAVDLAWTNPEDGDLEGVLVVRTVADPLDAVPEDGDGYGNGDSLGDGTVVANDLQEAYSDAEAAGFPGVLVYTLFAFDESDNYSDGVSDDTAVPIPEQTATIRVDPNTMTVVVSQQPELFELAGTVMLKPAQYINAPQRGSAVIFTSTAPGAAGNGGLITFQDNGDGAPLTVDVSGSDITIGIDFRTHTAREVEAAVNNNPAAAALVTARARTDGYEMSRNDAGLLSGGSDIDLRVHLELTNLGVSRPVFNAKAVITSISDGTPVGAVQVDGDEAAWFGPLGMDLGSSKTASFDIAGFSGTTVDIEITLAEAPTVFLPADDDNDLWLGVDSSNSGGQTWGTEGPFGFRGWNEYPGNREALMAPNGRILISGSRTMPHILLVDLITGEPTVGVNISNGDYNGQGYVESLVFAPDHSALYVSVNHGQHPPTWYNLGEEYSCETEPVPCERSSGAATFEVVRLSWPELEVEGRLELTDTARHGRIRNVSLSEDGALLATPLDGEGQVALVNTGDMSLRQLVDVSGTHIAPRHVAVSPDGSKTYVGYRSAFNPEAMAEIVHDGTLDIIDNTTFEVTPMATPETQLGSTTGGLRFGPDGRLYYLRKHTDNTPINAPLCIFDPATESWTTDVMDPSRNRGAMTFSADGARAYMYSDDDNTVFVMNLADFEIIDRIDVGNDAGTGHLMAVTPY